METSKETKTCSLCGKTFTGCGNNPAPVRLSDGTAAQEPCCDECNITRVIPVRVELHRIAYRGTTARGLTEDIAE